MHTTPPDPLNLLTQITPAAFSSGHIVLDGNSVPMPRTPTVRQMVTEKPRRSRVFEKYGISYCCCSGSTTFWQACLERQLNPQQVLDDLRLCDMEEPDEQSRLCRDWTPFDGAELRRHIVNIHHSLLRAELPRISFLLDRVASEHGEHFPELWDLQGLFDEFKTELEWHMEREELHLFHALERLESGEPLSPAVAQQCAREICSLEQDHVFFHGVLEKIERITGGFRTPETACNTFRVMLDSMAHLTGDIRRHLREESEYLLPYALQRTAG